MESEILPNDAKDELVSSSDRNAQIVVWSAWSTMMLVTLVFMANYSRRIPLAEDWLMVQPLTGNEMDLAGWLWSQNNEHRIPLPRLILLILLQLTNGDFRIGGFFNIFVLGGIAAAMILTIRYLRGGRTKAIDVFFPLVLLHIGHSANLLMGWQVVFAVPTAITCILLLVLICCPSLTTAKSAILFSICLTLLPLSGANGLMFVPLMALWSSYCGILNWLYAVKVKRGEKWISFLLIGSSIIAICLSILYFVGYEHPSWNPPNPGFIESVKTIAKLLALAFGPVASTAWSFFIFSTLVLLGTSTIVLIQAGFQRKRLEKHRAFGLLLFWANLMLFSLAVGWGRAGYVPTSGLPVRYVLLSVPNFCAAFFIWELYMGHRLRYFLQKTIVLAMIFLLPFNTIAGFYDFANWYREGMAAVNRDIVVGASEHIIADKHRDFLIHWWEKDQLATHIQMLRDAGIAPFNQIKQQ